MGYKPRQQICECCGSAYIAKDHRNRFCSKSCPKKGEMNPNWSGKCAATGEKHQFWKGGSVGLDALHTYIRRRLNKPELCACCQSEPPYDLANISQEYKRDISDWEWLCRKCHMSKDGRMNNLKQYQFGRKSNKIF